MTAPTRDEAVASAAAPASLGDDGTDGEPPPRLLLDIVIEGGDWSAAGPLEPLVEAVAAALSAAPALASRLRVPSTACIAFSTDADVRDLNGRFRGQDKSTNVLSFPAPPLGRHGAGMGPLPLGDVILAAETVMAEARAQAIPAAHHVQHLVLHGLLHVLGYDHETEAEAEVMEGLERALLAGLGVPDPYPTSD